MKSRLYDCEILHSRVTPKRHRFFYRYFTFCLDLDEVDTLSKGSFLFGKGFGRIFRFRAEDFIFADGKAGKVSAADLKSSVIEYARQHGAVAPIHRIEIVAHMCTLGYIFNPAAFYFCYSEDNQPVCAILEVTNTYREKKAYFLGPDTLDGGAFHSLCSKFFYVSPFVDLEASFEMTLIPPGEALRLQINSKHCGALQIHTLLTGKSVPLTDFNLALRFLSQPLITLEAMAKIHYQALWLFLKRIPYFKKADRMELQRGGLK